MKAIYKILIFALLCHKVSGQNICQDSSYRIQYIFGNDGAVLSNLPDITGINFMHGGFSPFFNILTGVALLKTTWGDSVLSARKINIPGSTFEATKAPDGSYYLTGAAYITGGFYRPLIIKLNSNGRVLWAKTYEDMTLNGSYSASAYKVFVTSNAIYTYLHGLTKLDLNGNILWSKRYSLLLPRTLGGASTDLNIVNNKLYFLGNVRNTTNSGPGSEPYVFLSKIDENTGTITESYAYKTPADTLIKGIIPTRARLKADSTLTFIGYINIDQMGNGNYNPRYLSLTNLDNNLNATTNIFYKSNNLDYFGGKHELNNFGEKAILARDYLNFYTTSFFLSFDEKNEMLRSRKFTVPIYLPGTNGDNISLDDKQNIHFIYNYNQNGKIQTEYARISNLSPNSTLNCFGKDTSILTRHPFTLIKEPFTWDNVQDNFISVTDVPYTEDTAFVTKQLICKIVSYCDSLKITGPASACINAPVRYTVKRNNTCQKFTEWRIDTAFASIITMEADSAITLTFKKAFNGYLHAALSDCVVKDSIFIKAVTPVKKTLLPRQDSLLCPGKTLTLTAAPGFTNYVWSGIAGQSITVNSIGQYLVQALDSCNNLVTDSITVLLADTALTITPSQTICLYDSSYITLPNGFSNITWQPTITSLLRNNTIVAYPAATTLYTITAQRQPNCPISRFSLVTVKPCPQTFYIPNSFTPNNDGLNDKFKPTISQPLAAYRFTIYNRYGQTIFTTTNQNLGWDGTFKNTLQPMGGYIYQCSYRFNAAAEKFVKGYFMLLR